MFAGHYQDSYPIGGHIHLYCQPKPKLIDSLDTVLYSLSNVIDDKEQRTARENSGYGKISAYRIKNMEWSTDCGLVVLVHPLL